MSCALKDRPPFKPSMVAQDGWYQDGYTRTPRMVSVPFRMAPDCQFQIHDKYSLPDCIGCKHKTQSGPTPADTEAGKFQAAFMKVFDEIGKGIAK